MDDARITQPDVTDMQASEPSDSTCFFFAACVVFHQSPLSCDVSEGIFHEEGRSPASGLLEPLGFADWGLYISAHLSQVGLVF